MAEWVLRYKTGQLLEICICVICGIFFSLSCIYAAIFNPPSNAAQLPWLYGVLVASLVALVLLYHAWRFFTITFRASDEWVISYRKGTELQRVQWCDVSFIKYNSFSGRLQIRTRHLQSPMIIGKQLEAFSAFLELVENRTGLKACSNNEKAT